MTTITAIPEPKWGTYPTRIPVVKACSTWHQLLREAVPDAAREKGIIADWPRWQAQTGNWKIELGKESDNSRLVTVVIRPDGHWKVWLHVNDDEAPQRLEGQENYEGDSQAGMEAAFYGLVHNANAAIVRHLTEMMLKD